MGAGDQGRGVVEAGSGHLRGHETRPDQTVEIVLFRRQMWLDHLRSDGHVHRADGFVGVLGPALGLVDAGLFGQMILAEGLNDEITGRLARLVRDARGVGTHVGDQRRKAPVTQFHAFIEALGDVHGAFGRVGKTLVGRLLQGGGDEGRLGRALALLFLHAFHHKGLALERGLQRVRLFRIADNGLLAADLDQLRLERRRHVGGQQSLEQPVFLGLEGFALGLALHDQAQCHGTAHAPAEMPRLMVFQSRGEIL